MNSRVLGILLKKEIQLMKRNPFLPRIIVMLPVMAMLLLPLVATFDVKNVGVAIVDNDHTQLSRRIVADIDASDYLRVVGCNNTYRQALSSIESGLASVIVTIPKGYSADVEQGIPTHVDIAADGVDAIKGMTGARYTAQSITTTAATSLQARGIALDRPTVSVLNYYNPTLNFRNYMIPALMVILIIIICGFLPTLSLVGEKESGTIEAMNVTPVGKFTFVLSKLIPYWVVGILVVTIGMIIGWAVYGLSPAGPIGYIYLAAVLFSLVMSGLGVSIANSSTTMLQSIFVMMAVIIIFQLMSGLFTPITSMPQWAQYLTYANPPRYFIEIMRSVYLKGAGFVDLWQQYACLTGFALLMCILAVLTYRKRN